MITIIVFIIGGCVMFEHWNWEGWMMNFCFLFPVAYKRAGWNICSVLFLSDCKFAIDNIIDSISVIYNLFIYLYVYMIIPFYSLPAWPFGSVQLPLWKHLIKYASVYVHEVWNLRIIFYTHTRTHRFLYQILLTKTNIRKKDTKTYRKYNFLRHGELSYILQ